MARCWYVITEMAVMAALATIKHLSSTLTRFSLFRSLISYKNFLDDCLVWTTRQYCLKETRLRARKTLSSPETLHYISSGESCEDDVVEPRSGPRPRKIKRLSWEKSKLRNIKAKLDEGVFGRTNPEAASHKCTCQPNWKGIITPTPN